MTDSLSELDGAVTELAARAELACAAVALCSAHRAILLHRLEVDDRGQDTDLAARAQMIRDRYISDLRAFVTAWRRGPSAVENMRVIEVAVHGYVAQFDVDERTKAAGHRMLLDFMRTAVWRLPAPETADGPEGGPALVDLERRLEALLAACRVDGAHRGPATMAAANDVKDAIGAALGQGCELARLQVSLDWWSKATGGPGIEVRPCGRGSSA